MRFTLNNNLPLEFIGLGRAKSRTLELVSFDQMLEL